MAIDEDIIAWWNFEDGALVDATGNGHDGTLTSGEFLEGVVGDSLAVDGNADYATVPHDDAFNAAGSFSISVWVRPASPGLNGIMGILCKGPRGGNPQDWGFYLWGGQIGFDFNYPSGEAYKLSTGASIPLDQWTHIAGVRDIDSGVIRFYQDGAYLSEIAWTTPIVASGTDLVIATDAGTPHDYSGQLDELMYWGRALSDEEVSDLYSEVAGER